MNGAIDADADRWMMRRKIAELWDWPSPEAGFVAWSTTLAKVPDLTLPYDLCDADRRRLCEAPVLASVGYVLDATSESALQDAWRNGFDRLVRRDPFPPDRMVFTAQPLELLGVCLGAMNCTRIATEQIQWLRDVVKEVIEKKTMSDYWDRCMASLCAHALSRPWGQVWISKNTPFQEREASLARWCRRYFPDILRIEDEKCLSSESLTRPFLPDNSEDLVRLALELSSAVSGETDAKTESPFSQPQNNKPESTVHEVSRMSECWMLVGTEWSSGHGGLSTFNRELCCALAAIGLDVVCLVPATTQDEIADAKRSGVHLITPQHSPGIEGNTRLFLKPELPPSMCPSVILGHGRITGPAARVQSTQIVNSRRVHVLHMFSEGIDWSKAIESGRDVAEIAEVRVQEEVELSRDAHAVLAVGPRLTRDFRRSLTPHAVGVSEILPGVAPTNEPDALPPVGQCLVLGRAEDVKLKGLDVAARAVGYLEEHHSDLHPFLVVRGAPPGTGAELRAKLIELSARTSTEVRVRNFSSDRLRIIDDIHQSSVVLMPSEEEGFGLVGIEAIAAGVPCLVSKNSGLAELLERDFAAHASSFVVPRTKNLDVDGIEWGKRIAQVLRNPAFWFAKAKELRASMMAKMPWVECAQQVRRVVSAIEAP